MKHQNPGFVSDEGDETEDDFPAPPKAAAVVAGGTPRQLGQEENHSRVDGFPKSDHGDLPREGNEVIR